MTESNTIGPLTKVALAFHVITDKTEHRPVRPDIHFEFIYGIGTQGITSFEKDLHAKSPGDSITFCMNGVDLQDHFEHLLCPLMEVIQVQPPVDLEIEVKSVTPASSRELVSAMAKLGGGCHGDCDCGCGS